MCWAFYTDWPSGGGPDVNTVAARRAYWAYCADRAAALLLFYIFGHYREVADAGGGEGTDGTALAGIAVSSNVG